ncbi:hypothetical protein GCM10023224_08470 [Streptomonospora halophila]|uniref:Uncharacterized protein n=1 Tax=Streptomonospora halophila TaxID=427369 RepID=A0ABP9G6R0_9ACTN
MTRSGHCDSRVTGMPPPEPDPRGRVGEFYKRAAFTAVRNADHSALGKDRCPAWGCLESRTATEEGSWAYSTQLALVPL